MHPLPQLELRHLHALVAVVEEGTFARAAEALGFTQSAVSQQIAGLERAVGASVLDRPRGPRAAALTPMGAVLLDHARQVLAQVDQLADELDRIRRGVAGRVTVGTFQSITSELLPSIIARARVELPDLDIRLVELDDQERLLAMLLADELDLAFAVDTPSDDDFESTPLGEDPFVLLTPAGALAGPSASAADVADQPMIGQNAGVACQRLIDHRLADQGVRPDYVFRSQDNGAVQGMVRSGMGRAVMPLLAIDPDDPGIDVWHLDPPLPPRTIDLVRRRNRTPLPASFALRDIVVEVAATRLDQPDREPVG